MSARTENKTLKDMLSGAFIAASIRNLKFRYELIE